eukprot:TRINITY_DN35386_c0_g1_i1.p1 TRINITY_DN35386_c0_g1~~TRINITY_DN35386_c0_g1_i1.p1  ORF type:complete len:945 (-),score=155.97 TRINITY_DN35386_c0_g1_i1:37-2844(-)
MYRRCLVAAALWTCLVKGDECSMEGSLFGGFQRLVDARKCLDALTITAEVLYHTVRHVEHGILDLYSFDSLAGGSRESEQSVSKGCSFEVHDVNVDVRQELSQLKAKTMEQFGLVGQEFETLLEEKNRGKTLPAYPIHSEIAEMFRRLYDGHTVYIPPWVTTVYPWYIYVPSDSPPTASSVDATDRIKLKVIAGETQPEVWMLGEYDRQVLEVVDGHKKYSAFDWIKQTARDRVGTYKSLGARVNSQVNAWGLGLFALGQSSFPESDNVTFKVKSPTKLDDGDVYDITMYAIVKRLGSKSRAEVNEVVNVNDRWTLTKEWLDSHITPDRTERHQRMKRVMFLAKQLAAKPAEPSDVPVHPWQRWKMPMTEITPGSSQKPHLELQAARRLQMVEGVDEIARYPDPKVDWGHAPEIFVYHLRSKSTAVLRVTSFMPPAKDSVNILNYFAGIIRMYKAAVGTGAKRLLLDLTDNGGGVVEAANVLIQLIAPRHDTKKKLCNPYKARLEPFWRDWLDSFGGKWEKIAQAASNMSATELVEKLEQLKELFDLADGLGAGVPLNAKYLATLLLQVEDAYDPAEKKRLIMAALETQDILQHSLLVGEDASSGWFPFPGDVKDMDGNDFHPATKPYLANVRHKWGNRISNYSDNFQMACSFAFNRDIDLLMWQMGGSMTGAKHQWKELAVLTNGLCGSACSMTATKLQMAEGATVFTFGGVPGEKMDVSAFAGGNVEQYKEFWPTVLQAALIGDILHGPNTKIGQRLRAGAKIGDFDATLLLPLPTPAVMTFNFNMIFEPTLGERALPREFYLFPAHKHYDRWLATEADPFSMLSDRTTPSGLLELFRDIAEEDWKAVRESASGFDSCGEGPPTKPFHNDWDWGWYVYPLAILRLIVVGVLCTACYRCCCGMCKGRNAAEAGPAVEVREPGVQLQQMQAQPAP